MNGYYSCGIVRLIDHGPASIKMDNFASVRDSAGGWSLVRHVRGLHQLSESNTKSTLCQSVFAVTMVGVQSPDPPGPALREFDRDYGA